MSGHTRAILLLFASLLSSINVAGSPNNCPDKSRLVLIGIPSAVNPPKICGGGLWFISCAAGIWKLLISCRGSMVKDEMPLHSESLGKCNGSVYMYELKKCG
jgi:hypothetical protein